MTSKGAVILVIEDEAQMRRFLRGSLVTHGYRVVEATTGEEGLAEAASRNPEIVLLDLGLPDLDGLEVTRRLRQWTRTAVIVISARGQRRRQDQGPRRGRGRLPDEAVQRGRAARADPRRPVFLNDREVHLTPTEYRLLGTLIKNAGRVVTHRQLLKEVWGPLYVEHTQYLRTFMGQLRQKLEPDPAKPRYLINEAGVGYRLRVEA